MISFLSKAQVRNLVIADDDRDDQVLLKEAIEEFRLDVKMNMVFDGVQLLHHLRTVAVLPDLILLDMNMPNKNGLECISEIRADKQLDHLPVVFLSTSCNLNDILKSYDLGASLFFSKPNSFSGIRHLVQSLLFINWKDFPHKLDKNDFTKLAIQGADVLSAEPVQH
ncbi:MAG: response regulator [Bacteroidota bacterium]